MKDLDNIFKESIHIPNLAIRYKSWFRIENELYSVIIDGLEQRITSSSDKEVSFHSFSGKKKYHSFTKLLGVNQFGKIWFISRSYLGSLNDLNLASFPENFIFNKLTKKEKIMGDNGFRGLKNLNIYTEFEDEKLSSQFKHYRSVVENVIAHIRIFKICSDTFKCFDTTLEKDLKKHERIYRVVCSILNLYRLPIRFQK